jgi:hypothetical protein
MMIKTMQHPLIKRIGYLAIFIALISGINNKAAAQDLLKLKSGKELKVNIVEEGTSIIKYRDYQDPSGPVYSIGRDKVDSIEYKKGGKGKQEAKAITQAKDTIKNTDASVKSDMSPQLTTKGRTVYLDGVAQSSRSIRLLMEDQPEALKTFESGKKMFTASNACPMIALIITFAASQSINDMTEQSDKLRVGIPVLTVDAALIVAGIILSSKGKVKLQKSVSLYNSSVNKPVQSSLSYGVLGSGVGFALKF